MVLKWASFLARLSKNIKENVKKETGIKFFLEKKRAKEFCRKKMQSTFALILGNHSPCEECDEVCYRHKHSYRNREW